MKIYHYHSVTKEYKGSTIARPNPVVEGEYLVPANTTTKAPPGVTAGHAAVFDVDNQEWIILQDNRTRIMYSTTDASPAQVTQLGPCPVGWTMIPRGDVLQTWDGLNWSYSDANKEKALEMALAIKGDMIRKQIEEDFVWKGKKYPLTIEAQLNINTKYVRAIANLITSYPLEIWSSGVMVSIEDALDFRAFHTAMDKWIDSVRNAGWAAIEQIKAMKTEDIVLWMKANRWEGGEL